MTLELELYRVINYAEEKKMTMNKRYTKERRDVRKLMILGQ